MVKGIHPHPGQVQVRMVREHSTLHQGLDTVVGVEMAPVGEWEVLLMMTFTNRYRLEVGEARITVQMGDPVVGQSTL